MFLDHFTYCISPDNVIVFPIAFLSRLTASIMAFFIAEGYFYTRNVKKYMKRLGIFAIISYIPYVYYHCSHILPIEFIKGNIVPAIFYRPNLEVLLEPSIYLNCFHSVLVIHETSIIFTLFLGLFSIYLWDKMDISKYSKLVITLVILYIASFSNYHYFIVILCLIFYFLKDKPLYKWLCFSIIGLLYAFNVRLFLNPFYLDFTWEFTLFKMGIFLIPFLLLLYNGEPGGKSPVHKWFFYIFYPAHLILIGILGFVFHIGMFFT